jgi:hypothetical protein
MSICLEIWFRKSAFWRSPRAAIARPELKPTNPSEPTPVGQNFNAKMRCVIRRNNFDNNMLRHIVPANVSAD